MKKYLLLIFILSFVFSFGQNAIVGTGFTDGWGSAGNNSNNYEYFSASAGNSYLSTQNANSSGNNYFRFGVDWGGILKQLTITSGSDISISAEQEYQLDTNNTGSGSMIINASNTTDNYVFKTYDAGSSPTGKFIFFKVEGTIRTISSVSTHSVYSGNDQVITATLSGALSSGQGVYLRYTSDNFTNSTITEMSCSGTSCTGTIPAATNTNDADIKYYVFTSGDGLTISHANADWYTINMNNNSGNNFSYNSTTQLDQGYGVFGYSFDSPTDTAEDNGTANDSDFVSDSEKSSGKALSEWTSNGVTLTHNTSENKGVLGTASGSMQVAVPDGNSDYIQTRQRDNGAYMDVDYAFTKGTGNTNTTIEDQATLSFWMKSPVTTSGSSAYRIVLFDGGSEQQYSSWVDVSTAGSWVEYTLGLGYNGTEGNTVSQRFGTIDGGLRIRIQFGTGLAGQTVYIDDITVTGLDVPWYGQYGTGESSHGNWAINALPSKYDDVVVDDAFYHSNNNALIINDATFEVNNLYLRDGGSITLRDSEHNSTSYPRSLIVNGNMKIESGGVLSVNKGSELEIKGNLTDLHTTGGNVIFHSDQDQFSALTVDGTYTNGGSGNKLRYNLYVNGVDAASAQGTNGWDLKGSPLLNGNVQGSAFAQNGSQYGLKTFSVATNSFTATTTSGSNSLTNSIGYAMAKAGSGGTVAITGGAQTAQTTVELDAQIGNGSGGTHWNLLANPFTTYVAISSEAVTDSDAGGNVWTKNNSILGYTSPQAAIYLWNGTDYSDIINGTTNTARYLAPGQAFFVSFDSDNTENSGGVEATFTFQENHQTTLRGMSLITTDDAISGQMIEENRAELHLNLEQNSLSRDTKIIYMEDMTDAIDKGYDAAPFIMDGESFEIISRVPGEDDGTSLAIQALNFSEILQDKVIPLGINALGGDELTISISHRTTPADLNIYLEDTEEGTMTNLLDGDYVLNPTSDLEGIGRFFIHMTADTMSNGEVSTSMLNAYKQIDASYITIEGLATQTYETKVSLYNILGREVLSTTLNNNMGTQTISTVGLSAGIYVIELESGSDRLTKKLLIQ